MGMNEDFWGDLLAHIRHQVLVPVVGPHVTTAKTGNTEEKLTTLIGQHLAKRYDLAVSPGTTTMDDAVAAFLQERGRDEANRLYSRIDDIIVDLDPEPGGALRDLAAIDDFRWFVSTTPDTLLAKALDEVRFQGKQMTRVIPFSPNQATPDHARNAREAEPTDTVVLNLFGQTASTPQYAIHEEDRLEWIHTLLTQAASLPEWLDYPLKHQPILFIGCELPDWLGRIFLRLSSGDTRLPLRDQPFFFAGCEPSLSSFFATHCRSTLVQQLKMEPTEFVAELRGRWEEKRRKAPAVSSRPADNRNRVVLDKAEIFISYMREDAGAARRLYDAITELGGEVWLDERALSPGDAWEPEILSSIRRTVRLFVPIISANTERVGEGYVFREWDEAVERSRSILGRRFIVPVIIDDDYDGDVGRYKRMPPGFERLQFGRAPGGEPDAGLLGTLQSEIREMRLADSGHTDAA
jgi:hypothetical protein